MVEEKELKECPFCGSIDVYTDTWATAGHREFCIMCNNCSAHGPFDLSERQAIKIWNLRQPMDKIVDVYRELLRVHTVLEEAMETTIKLARGEIVEL